MNQKSKYQYVFSMKLAGILMTKGFKLLRINHHLSDNTKDVYVFELSEKMQEEIEKYIKAKEKNNYGTDNQNGKSISKRKDDSTL